MRRILSGAIAVLFSCSFAVSMAGCSSGDAFGNPDVTYAVDASNVTAEISDTLFGVFLEDINYASYAMDDNLIMNGSFEYKSSTNGWTESGATWETISEGGIISTNPTYQRIYVTTAGATLTNSGYDAVKIAVTEATEYNFSAFIKAEDYDGEIVVRVTDGSTVYAESSFSVSKSDEWVKYKTTLTASGTKSSSLKFVMEFKTEGTICIDSVALETTDSTIGIKNYIYEAIADLSPKFIRFPGGCVIEGRTMDDAYDWKNSIGVNENDKVPEFTYTVVEDGVSSTVTTRGEAATRKPNTDIWQGTNYYLMEYALGFYEYFLLCDSLGASAIPIVNCGLSCMIQTNGTGRFNTLDGRYGNKVQDYIQDALDLVAFAKGDVNSSDENEAYWANVRKAMGHEEPFEMTYLGVGNEQWGEVYYNNYYEQFLVAFKEAAKENASLYGDIELIVGNGVAFGDCEKNGSGGTAKYFADLYKENGKIANLAEYGVQDHHYYMNYVDFLSNTTLYDSYTRGGEKEYHVFVGEYSANSATTLNGAAYEYENNNWMTALSEAAYMTGLERNGDIVKLAAYAPMFGSNTSSYNQWAADMMFYTNTQLVLTPNYYVQQLFARNQGTGVLSTETTYSDSYEKNYKLNSTSSSSANIAKLYQIVSVDEATGDIIIKLVNASGDAVKVNFQITGASVKNEADVTVLQNENTKAKNTLGEEEIVPVYSTKSVAKKFGYSADAYSVSVIRLHVK